MATTGLKLRPMIDKIFKERLGPLSFKYDGKVGSGIWRYARSHEDVQQYIFIQKSYHSLFPSISCHLSTSLRKAGEENIFRIAKRVGQWVSYDGVYSLEKTLNHFVDLILKFGLEWLDNNSIPDLIPPPELHQILMTEHAEKSSSFIRKYGIDIGANAESIKLIADILIQRKEELGQDVDWELILQASACYGELIIKHIAGYWKWGDYKCTPAIQVVLEDERAISHPLLDISEFWGNPKGRDINDLFLNIKTQYLDKYRRHQEYLAYLASYDERAIAEELDSWFWVWDEFIHTLHFPTIRDLMRKDLSKDYQELLSVWQIWEMAKENEIPVVEMGLEKGRPEEPLMAMAELWAQKVRLCSNRQKCIMFSWAIAELCLGQWGGYLSKNHRNAVQTVKAMSPNRLSPEDTIVALNQIIEIIRI
ncbi:MAG: hypothetical protein ACM3MK_00020 [Chitinophagales bacterium]